MTPAEQAESQEDFWPLVKARVRVALPLTVEISRNGVIIERGQLLHVQQRAPSDAMWWALMVYAVHFPDVPSHKR